MSIQPNFYSVIIGTELLNGRRKDAHFAFLNSELLKRGYEQKASFVIKDDPLFMEQIFTLIKKDSNSVMFCFGGIGATPDDFTREVAARAFTQGQMYYNGVAQELIVKQFGKDAYPHRIEMSNLPLNAKLLDNVVNNVPGFYLENRFFFTPGFPSMSQAMVKQALDMYFKENKLKKYRKTLTAYTGENTIIPLMKKYFNEVEISSLPRIKGEKREVVLSIVGEDELLVNKVYKSFEDFFKIKSIDFLAGDIPY